MERPIGLPAAAHPCTQQVMAQVLEAHYPSGTLDTSGSWPQSGPALTAAFEEESVDGKFALSLSLFCSAFHLNTSKEWLFKKYSFLD